MLQPQNTVKDHRERKINIRHTYQQSDIKQPLGDCDKRLLQFQKYPLGKLQAASYHRFEHSAWDMSGSKPSNHLEQKLRDILGAYAYQGPEHEEKFQNSLLSLEELSQNMLCTSYELLDILLEMPDVTSIDGYWRVVDELYLANCVVQICNLVKEQKWDPDSLPDDDIREILSSSYPDAIIDLAFKACCHAKQKKDPYSLSEKKVPRFYAIHILHKAKRMALNEFYSKMKSLLPLGFEPTSEHLKGVAIEDFAKNVIIYFPKSSLSSNMADRFKQIFSTNEKWEKSHLDLYIKDILGKDQSLDKIYSQYCNMDTQNDEIFYTQKLT